MIKFRHIILTILSLGLVLFLTGCNMHVLDPKGIVAVKEKQLLIDSVLLMLIVVVPVIILTFVLAIIYRSSNTKAKYAPNWAHGTLLEAGWWLIPIAIIIVLATMTWRSTHDLDPYKPLDSKVKPIVIQVVSLEWRWLFIYPEQNIATINFVEFPVDTPVRFLITSDAPMNSFQIQQLAGQIYAMAGMQTKLNLMANTPGDYYGLSTNFSGDGFSDMKFVARVTTKQDFDQWVSTVQHSPNKLSMNYYNTQLVPPSKDHSVQYFSSVEKNLYNMVIMKFMTPNRHTVDVNELGVHL